MTENIKNENKEAENELGIKDVSFGLICTVTCFKSWHGKTFSKETFIWRLWKESPVLAFSVKIKADQFKFSDTGKVLARLVVPQ